MHLFAVECSDLARLYNMSHNAATVQTYGVKKTAARHYVMRQVGFPERYTPPVTHWIVPRWDNVTQFLLYNNDSIAHKVVYLLAQQVFLLWASDRLPPADSTKIAAWWIALGGSTPFSRRLPACDWEVTTLRRSYWVYLLSHCCFLSGSCDLSTEESVLAAEGVWSIGTCRVL